MKRNVGNGERVLRALGALALALCAVMAPLPLAVRLAGLATLSAYMMFTALAGSCLGYRLMGVSTCPVQPGK